MNIPHGGDYTTKRPFVLRITRDIRSPTNSRLAGPQCTYDDASSISIPDWVSFSRSLAEQGVLVIVISHNMQDVFAVADRIVVMRRGRKVGELKAKETTPDEVVSLMVGAEAVHEMGVIPRALNGDAAAL